MTRRTVLAALLAVVAIFAAGFIVGQASASRPAQQTVPGSLRPVTTDAPASVPSRTPAALAGTPQRSDHPAPHRPDSLPGHGTQAPKATGMRAAPSKPPRTASTLRGTATWYAYRRGEAAAGPALRAALGPGWRGSVVYVEGLRVRLTDWMRADRLIDLDSRTFAALAELSRGVLPVTVSW